MSPDGKATSIFGPVYHIDWPRNIASGGLGCCGFAVLDYAARWQGVEELVGLPQRMLRDHVPGGASPSKVSSLMQRYAPDADWFQSGERTDELLEALCKSKRMSCVNYDGWDPHYSGSVAHCVNLIYFDRSTDWVAVLDNNYPSETEVIWMGVSEFKRRWGGWAYALLAAVPGHAEEPPRRPVPAQFSEFVRHYRWQPIAGHPGQSALYVGQTQIGTWVADTSTYWRLMDGGEYAPEPEVSPIPPPAGAMWPALLEDGVLNFGVQKTLLREATGITRNGKPTSLPEVLAAIGGEMVPAKPATPSGGGGLDLGAVYGGVPLWLLLCLGVTILFLFAKKGQK